MRTFRIMWRCDKYANVEMLLARNLKVKQNCRNLKIPKSEIRGQASDIK
jgi:hypothetical protein